ncbi:MAG: hypothetical protein R2706_06220 [Acidimicrobiales bacterium]
MTQEPDTNIIKLPNISASVPPAQGRRGRASGAGLRPT